MKFDPQSDSSIQTKARGLLHMECDYLLHTIHQDLQKFWNCSGEEHLAASAQFLEYSESHEVQELLDDGSEALEDLQLLGYEELEGLVRPWAIG